MGYAILELRRQVDALAAENARLLVRVSALRSPERIERIATRDLGMVTPRPQQVASLPVAAPMPTAAEIPVPTVWDRVAAWFVRSEAAAGEPSR
jgi:hypothetical protein